MRVARAVRSTALWLGAHMHAGTAAFLAHWAGAAAAPLWRAAVAAAVAVSTAAGRCSAALLAAGRVFNTAVQRYLLPSDYVYVYLRAKLTPVKHLLQSGNKLWQAAAQAYREAASSVWQASHLYLTIMILYFDSILWFYTIVIL
jgi:pyrroloquinoline quinone (PQQ) biosynthesis protein C